MNDAPERIAEALFTSGVRAVFGVPGSGTSYKVIHALAARGVPFYGASHEGAAAIMAGAFGRQSGTLGCSISIKGPGLSNMLPGIASNHFERMPVLSIAEAIGQQTPPGRVHKSLHQKSLVSTLVKGYATPGDPEEAVRWLASLAIRGTHGPVHLDLTAGDLMMYEEFDEPLSPVEDDGLADGFADVMATIAASERPLLVVGALARMATWRPRLTELRVPVLTTLAAKGTIDERRPYAAGVFTGDGKQHSPEARLLPSADLVIGIGLRNYEILNPATITGSLVLVDAEASSAQTGFRATTRHLSATVAQFIAVLDAVAARQWGQDIVEESVASMRARLLGHPFLPAAVFGVLEELMPDAVLVADTGSFCTIAEHMWRASDPQSFLCSANGRYMGSGVPMAIGAAIADPSRPVICAVGDGGVRMYFAEIKLAIEHALPILFLFLTDAGYGSIAVSIPPADRLASVLTMRNPSWFRAAEAMGAAASRVEHLTDLREAAGRWRGHRGPLFLEIPFEPHAYLAMTEGLR